MTPHEKAEACFSDLCSAAELLHRQAENARRCFALGNMDGARNCLLAMEGLRSGTLEILRADVIASVEALG